MPKNFKSPLFCLSEYLVSISPLIDGERVSFEEYIHRDL